MSEFMAVTSKINEPERANKGEHIICLENQSTGKERHEVLHIS